MTDIAIEALQFKLDEKRQFLSVAFEQLEGYKNNIRETQFQIGNAENDIKTLEHSIAKLRASQFKNASVITAVSDHSFKVGDLVTFGTKKRRKVTVRRRKK